MFSEPAISILLTWGKSVHTQSQTVYERGSAFIGNTYG